MVALKFHRVRIPCTAQPGFLYFNPEYDFINFECNSRHGRWMYARKVIGLVHFIHDCLACGLLFPRPSSIGPCWRSIRKTVTPPRYDCHMNYLDAIDNSAKAFGLCLFPLHALGPMPPNGIECSKNVLLSSQGTGLGWDWLGCTDSVILCF